MSIPTLMTPPESALGWNRVKLFEYLGANTVAPVTPEVASLGSQNVSLPTLMTPPVLKMVLSALVEDEH